MSAPPVEQLRLGDHVCWTFDDDDERLAAMARLVAVGINDSHKVLYLTGPMRPEALLDNLDARGVPTGRAVDDGQLAVRPADEVYLAHGEFDPDRSLGALRDQVSLARDEGWKGLRLVKDMAW